MIINQFLKTKYNVLHQTHLQNPCTSWVLGRMKTAYTDFSFEDKNSVSLLAYIFISN